MSFEDDLVRGKQDTPPRICLYGDHAIGKSTLAGQFPAPIFINIEDGLNALDVVSFPRAESLADVKASIGTLMKEDHKFRTVVLDTADWLVEPLITSKVEAEHSVQELAYGKGALLIAEEFRNLLNGFDALRKKKGMNVVIIAHAEIKRFENPQTEPYDRYRPKLPARCSALLQEWCDVLAFAAFQVIVKKADAGAFKKTVRATTNGERLLHLVESPAYVAKSRYEGTPDVIAMSIAELAKVAPIRGL